MTPAAGDLGEAVRRNRRELAAVAVVVGALAFAHLVVPAAAPAYAVYARYAAYLLAFSVWMAWFVDWLAVRLGREPHPSKRDR